MLLVRVSACYVQVGNIIRQELDLRMLFECWTPGILRPFDMQKRVQSLNHNKRTLAAN